MVKKQQGIRKNKGKPRVSLIFSDALMEVAKVGTFGARKYNDHNWRKGMNWSFMMDAGLRHAIRYNNGKRIDDETELSNLAHICWNFLALLDYEINNQGTDDLFRGYPKKDKK